MYQLLRPSTDLTQKAGKAIVVLKSRLGSFLAPRLKIMPLPHQNDHMFNICMRRLKSILVEEVKRIFCWVIYIIILSYISYKVEVTYMFGLDIPYLGLNYL